MADLPELVQFDSGVYQIETSDPVLGGPNGIANQQAKQLANRTRFLKKQLDDILSGLNVPVGLSTIEYVQAQLNKLDHKQSVRVATTANISLSGAQTIDGVNVIAGDRVLVKNQTNAVQNGIYVASGTTWARAGDANEDVEVTSGLVVYVEEGTLQGKSRWQLTTPMPIVVGTTALSFGDVSEGYVSRNSPSFTGTPTTPKLARFATGGGIVSADAMKERGVEFGAARLIDLSVANISLTANDAGSLIVFTGSGGGNLTLPKANLVPAGAAISIRAANTTVSTNTLKVAAGDTLSALQSFAGAVGVMKSGDSFTVVSDGNATWYVISDSSYNFITQAIAQYASANQTIGDNSYQRFPGGFIIQGGTVNVTTSNGGIPGGSNGIGGKATVTMPVAFQSKFVSCLATQDLTYGITGAFVSYASPINLQQLQVSLDDAGSSPHATYKVNWLAIGF